MADEPRARDRRRRAAGGAALGAVVLVAAVALLWLGGGSPDRLTSHAASEPSTYGVTTATSPTIHSLVPTSLGSNPHDIFSSPSGDRAYVAALSQTVILDTTNAAAPKRLPGLPAAPGAPSAGHIIDPAINVVHQSDTVILTRKDGSRRTLLVITDERAGAAGSAECPGGGLLVYDVTGALERTPRKLGAWFIGAVGPSEAGDVGVAEDVAAELLHAHALAVGHPGVTLTWSFKTNAIAADGSFYGYGDDLDRGMDVYRFTPGSARPTTPLQPVDLLGGGKAPGGGTTTTISATPDPGTSTAGGSVLMLPLGLPALLARTSRTRQQRQAVGAGTDRRAVARAVAP